MVGILSFLLGWPIFRRYVSFREGKVSLNISHGNNFNIEKQPNFSEEAKPTIKKIVPWELFLQQEFGIPWRKYHWLQTSRFLLKQFFENTLPETNSLPPESGFRWKTFSFPFGFRPIFRCENFSFSEGNCFFPLGFRHCPILVSSRKETVS